MKINTNNLKVDINLVHPNKYNPKLNFEENEHNAIEYQKIKDSLEKFGQVDPVIVRTLDEGEYKGEYEIINGFHRHRAMKELGSQEIEIKDLGVIDFDTAVAIALQTEDTKIPIDNIELAGLMKELVTEDKDTDYWAKLLPYNAEIIQSKIDLIDFDFEQFNNEQEEGGGEIDNSSFSFKIKDEVDAEMCHKALNLASDDKNDAFVELCRSFIQMSEVGVDSDEEED